ncbi:MAG TPA: hypothetical protein VMH50_16210 [Thermoleophilia bacterium]|nr:hypothetical protein [Thermoleophilia bacterium]
MRLSIKRHAGGCAVDDGSKRFSRFQVRCEGRPSWALDSNGRRYYFDGLRFWAISSRNSRVAAAWQAPGHGWVHEDDCGCVLCTGHPSGKEFVEAA